ncbi:MAG: class I SAM-dependent methyltransferase [Bacteroidales bacterium]|nr:class I SAM-dependent methyltransferase [Bacteroidales bacterium]
MEFWEELFSKHGTLWNFYPSDSAVEIAEFFYSEGLKNILIPGVGYGRNAKPFIDKGLNLTGVEISESAIELAKEHGYNFPIFYGSILDMPFDNTKYDGVFCYSLLHLFNETTRSKMLSVCYNQLNENGYMVFVVVSINDKILSKEKIISANRYEMENGLKVYFYDPDSIEKQFIKFGLVSYKEIDEPIKFMPNEPDLRCYVITCRKT